MKPNDLKEDKDYSLVDIGEHHLGIAINGVTFKVNEVRFNEHEDGKNATLQFDYDIVKVDPEEIAKAFAVENVSDYEDYYTIAEERKDEYEEKLGMVIEKLLQEEHVEMEK